MYAQACHAWIKSETNTISISHPWRARDRPLNALHLEVGCYNCFDLQTLLQEARLLQLFWLANAFYTKVTGYAMEQTKVREREHLEHVFAFVE